MIFKVRKTPAAKYRTSIFRYVKYAYEPYDTAHYRYAVMPVMCNMLLNRSVTATIGLVMIYLMNVVKIDYTFRP